MADETTTTAAIAPDSPLGICLAFITTDPTNAEQLRMHHCRVCQQTAADYCAPDERWAACQQRSCGLRDSARLLQEQIWVNAALGELWEPERLSTEQLLGLAQYIHDARSVSPALGRNETTGLGLALVAVTLRGQVHKALVELLVASAGELRVNVDKMDARQIRDLAARVRKDRERMRRGWQRYRAAQLRREGVPDNTIAGQIGISPKAIRDWLGPREEWDRRAGGGSW